MGKFLSWQVPSGRGWNLLIALTISSAFTILLCLLLSPQWKTNDDVGMSMVAHGYGMAAIGMPSLIFSNVLWGEIVRAIPQFHRILGYSIPAPIPYGATTTCLTLTLIGSRALLKLVTEQAIELASIDPDKPWQNGTTKSFNGKFRDECPAMGWFCKRIEAKVVIEDWSTHYNSVAHIQA